ncbi:MAG: DNA polymerase III subunit delta' [Bacteroidetes Order II. Incertae sedis bacterium]|nr:DNA polymerase III subunit delta' [Bacteroidetes Order II. bacterium]
MDWADIIGQKRVKETLLQALSSGRVAQAYLFYGPEGVGKQAMGLYMAAALQCEPASLTQPETVLGFRKAQKGLHPDIHVFFPTPKDIDEKEISERLRLLYENPYRHVDPVRLPEVGVGKKGGKQSFYSVERINEGVKPRVKYHPSEGRLQVVLLLEADYLRVEAANAFLKILEEPNDHTVFILTSSRPERLLATILSRCQQVRFDPLQTDDLATALQDHAGLKPEEAQLYARMANGSYNKALTLAADTEIRALRELIVDYFRAVYSRNINQLAEFNERMAKMGRDALKNLMRLMLLWVRDLATFQSSGDVSHLVNVDFSDVIMRFCNGVPKAQMAYMADVLEEAHSLIERNVSEALILVVLQERLSQAMRGNATGALYVPLVAVD